MWRTILVVAHLLLASIACAFPAEERDTYDGVPEKSGSGVRGNQEQPPTPGQQTEDGSLPSTSGPDGLYGTPTPDPVRATPAVRTDRVEHVVQPGDTLGYIALRYDVSIQQITSENNIYNPHLLSVGQVLAIPAPILQAHGPAFKIIPDSELVYGPPSVGLDLHAEIAHYEGWLRSYIEEVDGVSLSGADVVLLVSQRYSVNPRLLLALLEYQGGWLTQPEVSPESQIYPMRYYRPGWGGLFSQLSWAADQLNRGYYLWRAGWEGPIVFIDGKVVIPGAGLNAGTVGIEVLFAQLYAVDEWRFVVSEGGFYQTLSQLFGNPFLRAVEPMIPPDLVQPDLQLPFEEGKLWSFTGGPHSAWGDWAAWAGLDFAPPGYALGCVYSDEWVVAVADGRIIRTENGAVFQDLDGDGYEQTGWVVLYLHIDHRERVQPGTMLQAGDRIGHPSCEGGVATGTHLHIARKYRGEWVSADGPIPFVLDGWVSSGDGIAYNGTLSKGTQSVMSCSCRNEYNQIGR